MDKMSFKKDLNYLDSKYISCLQEKDQHFRRMPHMVPWVGKDFDKGPHKKLLFIGESHYIPDSETDERVRESIRDWYSIGQEDFQLAKRPDKLKNATCPVHLIGKGVSEKGFNSKAHVIYKRIQEAIEKARELEGPAPQTVFSSIAYYNYFQRPAFKAGGSIKPTKKDKEVAVRTFRNVLNAFHPDAVCVVSKKAIHEIKKKRHGLVQKDEQGLKWIFGENLPNIRIEGFPHPGCSWWYRRAYRLGGGPKKWTGKEKMIEFLKEVEASE